MTEKNAPTLVHLPNDGTPAEKRAAALELRAMFEQYGVASAIVNAERLEREADEEEAMSDRAHEWVSTGAPDDDEPWCRVCGVPIDLGHGKPCVKKIPSDEYVVLQDATMLSAGPDRNKVYVTFRTVGTSDDRHVLLDVDQAEHLARTIESHLETMCRERDGSIDDGASAVRHSD